MHSRCTREIFVHLGDFLHIYIFLYSICIVHKYASICAQTPNITKSESESRGCSGITKEALHKTLLCQKYTFALVKLAN